MKLKNVNGKENRKGKIMERTETKLANTFLYLSVAVVGMLIASGCSSTRVGEWGDSKMDVESTVGGDKVSSSEKLEMLSISVDLTGADDLSESIAYNLDASLKSALIEKGIKVEDKDTDLILAAKIRAREFDKSGNFYLYEGDLLSQLKLKDYKKLLATKSFEVKGKRELGKQKAMDSCVKELEKKFVPWAADSLETMRFDLAVSRITFTNIRGKLFDSKNQIQSEKIQDFVRTVEKIDGIYTCELIESSYKKRSASFKVVYDKDKFKEGLLTKLDCDADLKFNPVAID